MLMLPVDGLSECLNGAYEAFRAMVRSGTGGSRNRERAIGATVADDKCFRDFRGGTAVCGEAAPIQRLLRELIQAVEANWDAIGQALMPTNPHRLSQIAAPASEHVLRLSGYPPRLGVVNHPHTDIDLFTLLPPATAPGIELLLEGRWCAVEIYANHALVVPGEFTNLFSGVPAIQHRVVGNNVERLSASLFVNASNDLEIAGRKVGDLFEERLNTVNLPPVPSEDLDEPK
jgi:hypothetical protein